jgi:nucleoid DNA-binding protein
MTQTRTTITAEAARRTGLRQHDVRQALEAIIAVCQEELVAGGRIELSNFLVLEVRRITRRRAGLIRRGDREVRPAGTYHRVTVRPCRALQRRIRRGK